MPFDQEGLRRRPLGREVTWQIKRMIIRSELKPRERLVEEKLAGVLGISRTPVREALHRLEQEGLLSKRAMGGYVVRPLTMQEVEEAVGVRAALEAYAADLAAQRRSKEILVVLADNVAQFDQAFADGDEGRLVALNTGFHSLVHQAAGSKLLSSLLGDMGDVVERISRAVISNLEAASWSCDEHRALAGAIREADGNRAARLARQHVIHGGQWIISRMQSEKLEL